MDDTLTLEIKIPSGRLSNRELCQVLDEVRDSVGIGVYEGESGKVPTVMWNFVSVTRELATTSHFRK